MTTTKNHLLIDLGKCSLPPLGAVVIFLGFNIKISKKTFTKNSNKTATKESFSPALIANIPLPQRPFLLCNLPLSTNFFLSNLLFSSNSSSFLVTSPLS